jgi:hypothetical protein
MKENRIKDVFESIAQRDVQEDVNIWPQIAAKVERKNFMQTVRTRPALALLLVLLALALLSSVAYAIGKVTGYIPGVGLVNQSLLLRILAEPVTVERDGITVTVDQLVADLDHTYVAYTLGGIRVPQNSPAMCSAVPSLQLPDGTTLNITGGGAGGFGGEVGTIVKFETTVYYPPVPAEVDQVTFNLDCVLPQGSGPENWQIPLVLIPAPQGFATPAIEVGATFVAAGPTFDVATTPTLKTELTPLPNDPSLPNTPTAVPHGSGLYLDQVIELPSSYILVGNFTDAGDLPGPFLATGSAYDYVPRIEDRDGNSVEFKIRDDIKPVVTWGSVQYWAYEIAKPVQGPITITLDEINIDTSSTVRFDFDTGPNPQPGQTWKLDLPIHLGRYDYVVDSAEMIQDGYLFRFHSGTNVPEGTSFILDIVGSSQDRGPTAGEEDRRPKDMVKYSQNITYLVPPPVGQLTVELTLFETVPLKGPWTLTWTPPNK